MIDVRTAESAIARPPLAAWVDAPVNYLADLSIKPVTYNPPHGTGLPRREGNYRDFTMRIHDARPIARDLSLDRQAFKLVHHETEVRDFYDEQEVRTRYHAEVEALIKRETGASKVVVFDHTVRTADRAVERGLRTPVRSVHCDYTEKSGPQRVRDLLPAEEAERRLAKRFAEYNVWRSIAPEPVEMTPLGLVDSESLAPRDLAICDIVYADRTGEIYQGVYNADHRWFYFPKMTREEAIMIKCYDSLKDGRARFSLHSAFDDPNTPTNPKPRQSIEARAFAFFD
ncbi:methyltransferase [Reyranella aquatilis]|uniref:Methyltransferase n=1 Tax=Reyranella aquatilis TaxID=2035356 RepID=A0ABS8KYJ0_9HYPH|nr:CmcJ/NvfI family oxidoreductase [Reyranella aquatilis]MCC8431167.1 methyltransferase [Reyranella aquatilis]